MKLHSQIQGELQEKYKKKGWDVITEASIPFGNGRFYIVDLLCTKGEKVLVFEVGRTQESKLKKLRDMGYEVRLIPFHHQVGKKFVCICGHEWYPRVEKPKACPNCKQYLCYDAPRKK